MAWTGAYHAPAEAKEEAVTGNLTGEPHLAGPSRLTPDAFAPSVSCPACGAGLFPVPDPGPVLRAAIPQSITTALLLARTLSARERAVFEWLGQGYDNRAIAREMKISERTVKRHVTVVLAKLRLESRLQAGLAALIISSVPAGGAAWPEGRMAGGPTARDNNRSR